MCADKVFRYKEREYYFCHDFHKTGPGKYHFGLAHTMNNGEKTFDTFDDIMNAVLIGGKPFKEIIPFVKWYYLTTCNYCEWFFYTLFIILS